MAAGLQNQLRAKYADQRLATCNIAALPNDNMPNNASNGRLLAVFGNSFGCGAVVAAAPSDGAVEFVEAAVGSGIGALGTTNKATIRMVSIVSFCAGRTVGSDAAGTSDGVGTAAVLSGDTLLVGPAAD